MSSKILYTIPDSEKRLKYDLLKKYFLFDDNECIADKNIKDLHEKMVHDTTHIHSPYKHMGIKAYEAIYSIIRATKPKLCIETGISSGVSSAYILAALQKNGQGRLISIDYRQDCGWLIPEELRLLWDYKLGHSKDVLPTIKQKIDFFLHDSNHDYDNVMLELEWAYRQLKKNGIIIADNIGTNNAFFDFSAKHNQDYSFISARMSITGQPRTFITGIIVKDITFHVKTLKEILN